MEQLSFLDAKDQKNIGMLAAEANANRKVSGWSRYAFNILTEFLTSVTGTFMAEDVRKFADGKGLMNPPSQRAWGGIITRAQHAGLIKNVGYGITKNPSAHQARATVWMKTV